MNLIYDQTPDALQELAVVADRSLPVHNIAVDFDGEVIIDPELHYPNVDLRRYKFCTQIRDASLRNARKIQDLHQVLMSTVKDQLRTLGGYGDMSMAA
jgi:hypothetical protein